MLRTILVAPDEMLRHEFGAALCRSGDVELVRQVTDYPTAAELSRLLRVHAPHALFVSPQSPDGLERAMACAESCAPRVPVVVFSRNAQPDLILQVVRRGAADFLSYPFTDIGEVVRRLETARQALGPEPGGDGLIFSFLPAKSGAGTSTLAVNVALAMSLRQPRETLLADFDLNSGVVAFMLKLHARNSLVDAVEHASRMDEDLWDQMANESGDLDVLSAGGLNPNRRLDPAHLRDLLAFMRRAYKLTCADLSGNLERYSLEVMHESSRVLLVCTPELPSLHLAREKVRFLRDLGLSDRVRLVVNRAQRRQLISEFEIEQVVGLPVALSLPNDYLGVHRAVTAGKPVAAPSPLGVKCRQLADTLIDSNTLAPLPESQSSRRFLEFFSVSKAFGARRQWD